jgi:hypothetical protein
MVELMRQSAEAEAKAAGKAEVLLRLLSRRFGPLSPKVEERVRDATLRDLDEMTDQILEAKTLQDVVGQVVDE